MEAAAEICGIIEGEGGTAAAWQADVTDTEQVARMVQACVDRFGRIDVLHNNVGGSAPGGPVEMTEEVWDRQLDHNLRNVYLNCKHVLPIMESPGAGPHVNIASVAGRPHYGDRKSGVEGKRGVR